MCDGSAASALAGMVSPDCNLFKYWWKLSLRATESCMIDKTNFGDSFAYDTHCNVNNIQAKYTYSEYPNGDTSVDKKFCIIPSNGRDIPIAVDEQIDTRGKCDLVVTVTASEPLNIPDTRDCFYYNVYAEESAKYLATGAAALAVMASLF